VATEPDPALDPLATEGINPASTGIDTLTPLEIARLMNQADAGVAGAVARQLPQIAQAIAAIAARLAAGGRLIYLGAGTSGRLGVLDAAECPPTFSTPPGLVVGWIAGGPGALTTSIEGAEDDPERGRADARHLQLGPGDALVGIAASGRTPYVRGALQYAQEVGALTVALACNAGSALAAAAEHRIEVVVGPELLTGSTRLKAGTAQKLVLNMISTITMIRLGKTFGNLMVDVRASNEKLRARSRRIVALATGADDPEIEQALTATGGEVKHAILAILAGVDGPAAARLLAENGGHLRAALTAADRTSS
jgi:N-acetylmuramic acid 6-phosphate etherase